MHVTPDAGTLGRSTSDHCGDRQAARYDRGWTRLYHQLTPCWKRHPIPFGSTATRTQTTCRQRSAPTVSKTQPKQPTALAKRTMRLMTATNPRKDANDGSEETRTTTSRRRYCMLGGRIPEQQGNVKRRDGTVAEETIASVGMQSTMTDY